MQLELQLLLGSHLRLISTMHGSAYVASNPLTLVPCPGGLPREAHPEVLGREQERVQEFQGCGTRRKSEPRGGQEHGHVCVSLLLIYHLSELSGLKNKTDENR